MPFSEPLQRRDSWPPTIVRLTNDPAPNTTTTSIPNTLSSIDENPISFFLTTPADYDLFSASSDEEFDIEDLSAGIEGSPESKALPIREISPSSIQRSPLPIPAIIEESEDEYESALFDIDDDDVDAEVAAEAKADAEEEDFVFGIGLPLSLKDFSKRHRVMTLSAPTPTSSPSVSIPKRSSSKKAKNTSLENRLQGLGISFPEAHTDMASKEKGDKARRGRAKVRLLSPLGPGAGTGTGRGRARSVSARRPPKSWRVPSPDIYRIDEEREDGSGDRKGDDGFEFESGIAYSSSAPVESHMGRYASEGCVRGVLKGGNLERRDGEREKVVKRVRWAV